MNVNSFTKMLAGIPMKTNPNLQHQIDSSIETDIRVAIDDKHAADEVQLELTNETESL